MRCLNCRLDGILQSTQVCPKCGVHLPSLLRDVLASGTLLRGGDYRIDYALGRGGFGITYRAAHTSLEKLVAIKEFYPQDQAHREGTTGHLTVPITQEESYQRGLQRFEREGRTLAKLNHPNVVSVVDFFKERGTAYLVMELLSGNTLKDELDSQPGKILPVERVKTVMTALVNALTAVHQLGIYHLDLKPDNVMVTPQGRIVLVDFGASRQNLGSGTSTHQNTRSYTEAYAAPELISSAEVGAASDVFELGMMLCEMLTGKLPPTALSRLFNDNWIPQDLDEPWQSMVTDALQMKPENRPETVLSWWETVLRFEEEEHRQEAERQRREAEAVEQHQREQEKLRRREAEERTRIEAQQQHQEAERLQQPRDADLKEEIDRVNLEIQQAERNSDFNRAAELRYGKLADLHRQLAAVEIRINPNHADAYYKLGLIHFQLGDNKAAIEDFNQAIHINRINSDYANVYSTNHTDAYYSRGLAHFQLGDNKAAIEDFNQVIRINSDYVDVYYTNHADVYHKRGLAHFQLGDNKAAIEDFKQAIRINPNHADAYYNRGLIHFQQGNNKAAIEDFSQTIFLNSNHAEAYYNRGKIHDELGDKKAAIEDYNQAIRLNANHANAYYNRGLIHFQLGDKKAAIEDYNQAIRLNANHANAYYNRGKVCYKIGNKKAAIKDYNQAIRLNPNNADVYYNRGVARSDLGYEKAAIEDYNQAIRLNPNNADAYNNRGVTRFQLGDKKAAIEDYNQAIRLNPNFAKAYNNRGVARSDLGDKQGAIADFQKATQLNQQQGNKDRDQNAFERLLKLLHLKA